MTIDIKDQKKKPLRSHNLPPTLYFKFWNCCVSEGRDGSTTFDCHGELGRDEKYSLL